MTMRCDDSSVYYLDFFKSIKKLKILPRKKATDDLKSVGSCRSFLAIQGLTFRERRRAVYLHSQHRDAA